METKAKKTAKATEEREKALLYKIASAIANVKNRNALMKLILEEVKSIFNFYDVGLAILDNDGVNCTDWSTLNPDISPSEVNYQVHSLNLTKLPFKNSLFEKIILEVEKAGHPLIVKFDEQLKKDNPDLKELFEVEMDYGYKEALVTYLKTGNKIAGVFNINSLKLNHFNDTQFHLFQAVADLVAVAVSNILAHEEIVEREQEKTRLLKISEAIATIQNYKELLRVIYEVVQPVFPFDNTGLFIITALEDGFTEITDSDILNSTTPSIISDAKISGPFPLKTFQKNSWIYSALPIVTTIEKEVEFIDDPLCRQQMNDNLNAGLHQMICGPLITGGKKIGAIYLCKKEPSFYNAHYLSLFKSLTDLIAIAVANILANEEIREREKEKTLLLSLSENMANIRNREDLLQTMLEKIKPIVQFDDAVISKYNAAFTQYQHIITSSPPEIKIHPLFAEIVGKPLPVKNNPDEYVLEKIKQQDVLEYNTDSMIAMYPNHFIGGFLKENGLLYNLYFKLVWAGDIIGFMNFHFSNQDKIEKKKFGLYKSIAEQVSVALANVLANEEISAQTIEIEKLNKQLKAQNEYLIEEVEQQYNFEEMVGQNASFKEVCRNIGLVAKTDSTVLILGETGTGKELVARAIHNHSPRKNKPLIKLNCAALPVNLIESELFGHERGAFTGAFERRIGKFELANGSTLFLDEVGELPLELQSKLLRALQEKEIERLGSNKTLQIDVRIIAATNRELEKEVQAGKFRQDLYYRLHIFPITLPSLRERKEDIPLLAAHFLERYTKKTGKKIQGFGSTAMQEMMSYNWPGNIRELEHVIERCVILSNTKLIQHLNLPETAKRKTTTSVHEFVIKPWQQQERDYILEVLKATKGNMAGKGGAAELLQLPPTTLQSKMNKLGIKRKHFLEGKENMN